MKYGRIIILSSPSDEERNREYEKLMQLICFQENDLTKSHRHGIPGNYMEVMMQLPRYKCHKEVWALKIKSIAKDGEGEERESDGSATIIPEESPYAPFKVSAEYMSKHKPEVGGYYVQYSDGYKSFSPAAAFEEGYSRI